MRQKGTKQTRNRNFRDQLWLGSKWEFNKTLGKVKGFEIAKLIVTFRILLQRSKNWTMWRDRPPPKRKKGNGPYGRNW